MADEEQEVRIPTQFLGKHGKTIPCVNAMVTILMSAQPPEKITLVTTSSEHDRHAVLFLVWDWLFPGITIVSDGFGTHGSSSGGGVGFSTVLGLIRHYHVHLLHARISGEDFKKIAEDGVLTERIMDLVEPGELYDWNMFPVMDVQKVRDKKSRRYVLEVSRDGNSNTFRFPPCS